DDLLLGGAGNDLYVIDSLLDTIDEGGNQDTSDSVKSSVNVDLAVLGGGAIEHATLLGSANLNASGNSADNILNGNSGDNVLDGEAGADTLKGGVGNDTYVIDDTSDVIDEAGNIDDDDSVRSTISVDLDKMFGGAIEHAVLLGSDNIDASGNAR